MNKDKPLSEKEIIEFNLDSAYQEGFQKAKEQYNELRIDRDKWMIKFAKQKEQFKEKIEKLKRYSIKGNMGLKRDKEGVFVMYGEIKGLSKLEDDGVLTSEDSEQNGYVQSIVTLKEKKR